MATLYMSYAESKQVLKHYFPEKRFDHTIQIILGLPNDRRDNLVKQIEKTLELYNDNFTHMTLIQRHHWLTDALQNEKDYGNIQESEDDMGTTNNTKIHPHPTTTEEEDDKFDSFLEDYGAHDKERERSLENKRRGGSIANYRRGASIFGNKINRRAVGGFISQKGYPRNPRGLPYELQVEKYEDGGIVDDAGDWLDMQAYNLYHGSNYSDLDQFREMRRPHLKIEREKKEQEQAQQQRYAKNPSLAEKEDYAVLESWGQTSGKPKPQGYDEWASSELIRRQTQLRKEAKDRYNYLQNLKEMTIKSGNKNPNAWPEESQKNLDYYRSVMNNGILNTLQGSLVASKKNGGRVDEFQGWGIKRASGGSVKDQENRYNQRFYPVIPHVEPAHAPPPPPSDRQLADQRYESYLQQHINHPNLAQFQLAYGRLLNNPNVDMAPWVVDDLADLYLG